MRSMEAQLDHANRQIKDFQENKKEATQVNSTFVKKISKPDLNATVGK